MGSFLQLDITVSCLKRGVFLLLLAFCGGPLAAQLNINTTMTPEELVESLVGEGVSYSDVTYHGGIIAKGYFSGGDQTNMGLKSGVLLTSGSASLAPGPNFSSSAGLNNNMGGDPTLTQLAGDPTFDASVLSFKFIPESDTIKCRYVFGSEEYPEFVANLYNDVFGFFVTGPNPEGGMFLDKNIALVPGTQLPVSISNINDVMPSYAQYYVNNNNGATIEYDGFTTVLTAWLKVEPCQEYEIKLAIADAADHIYDSGVFLEEGSFESIGLLTTTSFEPNLTDTIAVEGCIAGLVSFKVPDESYAPYTVKYTIGGTAEMGVDYENIPNELIIPAGKDSVVLTINPFMDDLIEDVEYVELLVENTLGCSTGVDTVKVEIYDNRPIVTLPTKDTLVCMGEEVEIGVWLEGGVPLFDYLWENGGTDSVTTVTAQGVEYWTVNVSDLCGQMVEDSVRVEALPYPDFSLGNDTAICLGEKVVLSAPVEYPDWHWNDGTKVPQITVTLPGVYWLEVENEAGCSFRDSIVVDLLPVPFVELGDDVTGCASDDITLDAGPGHTAYLWSTGATTQIVNVSDPGYYWVEVSNEYGCTLRDSVFANVENPQIDLGSDTVICANAAVNLNAGPDFETYEWQDGSTGQTFPVYASGKYWVKGVTENGCEAYDTITVQWYPAIQVSLGEDKHICEGDFVVFVAGLNWQSYLWNDGSDEFQVVAEDPGIYWVWVWDEKGCIARDSVLLRVNQPPVIGLGADTSLCVGEQLLLNAGDNFDSYQWNDNSNDQTQLVTQAGNYWVKVVDSIGCTNTDTIRVDELLPPQIDFGPDTSLCPGKTITLDAGVGHDIYQWQDGSALSQLIVEQEGYYWVKANNRCGDGGDTITIGLFELPQINLGDDGEICPGEKVVLDAGVNRQWYRWQDDSDGQTLTVSQDGTYWVEIFDGHCVNADTIFLEKCAGVNIVVPNVFTPNHDGYNDLFEIDTYGLIDFEIEIFDRWGKRKFKTDDKMNHWDGRSKGHDCDQGVYYYNISYTGYNESLKKISGTVQGVIHLVR